MSVGKPDYWAVVALAYDGKAAWVMAQAPECSRDGVTDGFAVEDFASMGWAKGRPPGLYRLTLYVSVGDGDMDVGVMNVEPMLDFPALPETVAA